MMDRARFPMQYADYVLAWPGSARMVVVRSMTQGSSTLSIVE